MFYSRDGIGEVCRDALLAQCLMQFDRCLMRDGFYGRSILNKVFQGCQIEPFEPVSVTQIMRRWAKREIYIQVIRDIRYKWSYVFGTDYPKQSRGCTS